MWAEEDSEQVDKQLAGLHCKECKRRRNKTFLRRCLVWKKIHLLGFKVLVSNTTNMTSLKETKKENPQGSLRWHISQISFRNVVFLQTPSQNDTGRTNVSFKKIGGGRMVGSFDVIFFKSREHHKKKKNYIHQNYTG